MFRIIFYHFHDMRFLSNHKVELGFYHVPPKSVDFIYKPYIRHLADVGARINEIDGSFDPHGTLKPHRDWKSPLRSVKRKIKKTYNIYHENTLGI